MVKPVTCTEINDLKKWYHLFMWFVEEFGAIKDLSGNQGWWSYLIIYIQKKVQQQMFGAE